MAKYSLPDPATFSGQFHVITDGELVTSASLFSGSIGPIFNNDAYNETLISQYAPETQQLFSASLGMPEAPATYDRKMLSLNAVTASYHAISTTAASIFGIVQNDTRLFNHVIFDVGNQLPKQGELVGVGVKVVPALGHTSLPMLPSIEILGNDDPIYTIVRPDTSSTITDYETVHDIELKFSDYGVNNITWKGGQTPVVFLKYSGETDNLVAGSALTDGVITDVYALLTSGSVTT